MAEPRKKTASSGPDEALPKKRVHVRRRAGKVALVGRPNVGKSTFLNSLLGERLAITSPHPQTTRDRIAGILTVGATQYVFLDTPGIHVAKNKLGVRMNQVAEEATREADVVVLMTDLGEEPRPELRPEDRAILEGLPPGVPTLLVLNKVDRVKDKTALFPVLEALAKAWPFAALLPVSARKKEGPERILAELEQLMPEGDFLYPEDELSDKPVRFFVAEYVREQILTHTRQEVPHGVAVLVETFEEGLRVPRIQLVVHVDKESHKAIVLGEKGRLMKEIGTRARARVEELLGRQVHLAIHVRATPRWYESDARLEEMGYGASRPTSGGRAGKQS